MDIFGGELHILTQFNTHMEEATPATLAKIWCFADSDTDRVNTSRHILGNEVLFQEAATI